MKTTVEIKLKAPFVHDITSPFMVKGFLSFNSEDLEGETITPESFDLDSFLQKRTLCYNHKMWLDERGNPIPVGEVRSGEIVKLVPSDDPTMWAIKSVNSGDIIGHFPKDRIPKCVTGDRGVWITASITVQEVWNRVLRGMLSGFSWHGKALMTKMKIGPFKKVLSVLADIAEVSVVFSPMNPSAMLVPAMKSAIKEAQKSMTLQDYDGELGVFGFVFSPEMFDAQKAASWLDAHKFVSDGIFTLDDGEIVAPQINKDVFDGGMRTVGVSTGVQAIVGPLAANKVSDEEKVAISVLCEALLGSRVLEGKEKAMSTAVTPEVTPPPAAPEAATPPVEVATAAETPVETPETKAAIEAVTPSPEVVPETPPPAPAPAETPVEAEKSVVVETTTVTERRVDEVPASQAPSVVVQPVQVIEVPVPVPAVPEPPVDPTVAMLKDQLKWALEGMVGQVGNVLVEAVNGKIAAVAASINDALARFADVAQSLSNALQSQATALKEAAVSKSATDGVDRSAELEAVQKKIDELGKVLEDITKTAVPATHREEPANKPVDVPKSPNDVFGSKGWPFVR